MDYSYDFGWAGFVVGGVFGSGYVYGLSSGYGSLGETLYKTITINSNSRNGVIEKYAVRLPPRSYTKKNNLQAL